MGQARMRITPGLLLELFPLPETAKILGSCERHGDIEIVVHDPAFPDVREGDSPLRIRPSFRRRESGEVEFVDWGIL